jgi:hypothetical protein
MEGNALPSRTPKIARRHSGAVWLLSASLCGVPTGTPGSDLPQRRETCQADARHRIKARKNAGQEIYVVLVERRQTYVRECMARMETDPTTTGSVPKGSGTGTPWISAGSVEHPLRHPVPPARPASGE